MKIYTPRRRKPSKTWTAALIFLNAAIWTWVFAILASPTDAEKAARPYAALGENRATTAQAAPETAPRPEKTGIASNIGAIRWRTVTAYNVGDPAQTDSTPCIGAAGSAYDLCAMVAAGERIVATNELPLFSRVVIGGEMYTVLDRTNERYKFRYDIAMPKGERAEALAFGRPTMAVEEIK